MRIAPSPLALAVLLSGCAAATAAERKAAPSCDGCHATRTAEHAASRHSIAATNPLFVASLARSPYRSWCLSCHAPEGDRDAGVGCASCHWDGSAVLGSRDDDLAPHALRADPALASAERCGTCHQFGLPEGHPQATPSDFPVQDTIGEWRRLGGDRSCADCHMGDAGHRFPAARDPAFLEGVVAIAGRSDHSRFRVELTADPDRVGHRVPTGDPFRQIVVRTCADPACADSAGVRRLELQTTPGLWEVVADDRLLPGVTTVVPIRQAPGPRTCWRVDLQLAEEGLEVDPREASLLLGAGCTENDWRTP